MNKEIIQQLFPDAIPLIEGGKCPTCGHDIKAEDFNDDLSVREFTISGMCQECQDSVFG